MQKIYHVFNSNTVHHVPDMIDNILHYFNEENKEHIFYLYEYNKNKDRYTEIENKFGDVKLNHFTKHKELNKVILALNESDKLIIHGFFYKRFWLSFFKIPKYQMGRVIWVCWGSGNHWKKGVLGALMNYVRTKIFKRLGAIVTLMQPDYIELTEKFKCNNCTLLPYFSKVWDFENNVIYKNCKQYSLLEEIKTVKVLIGNSASATNLHHEAFELLKKFSHNNMQFITPLAYGPESNKLQISQIGKEIFRENYIAVTEMMEINKYSLFISENADILVFTAKTQIGLFNLYFAAYCGKKIYANGYNYNWLESLGLKIYNTDIIKEQDLSEFTRPLSIDEISRNRKVMEEQLSPQVLVKQWSKLIYKN